MRVTSTTKEPLKRCVFFNRDNKCELEQLNAQPAACKAFPIILDRGILRLSASCKTGSTPAYILLKDKIIQLTSPEFYKKLERMMAQPDEKLFLLA
jgi:Fe-S-cluster containining protein